MLRQSWWLKHERAADHLTTLAADVARALTDAPSAEVTAGTISVRVGKFLQPSASWPAIAGDVVHNLRSALDHVAFALVRSGPYGPNRQTMFPVTESPAAFARTAANLLPGVSANVLDAIELRQPFQNGSLELAVIHGLDVIDKHRELHLMAPLLREADDAGGLGARDADRARGQDLQSELVLALDDPDLDIYGPVRETFDYVAPALPLLGQLRDWTAETLKMLDAFVSPGGGSEA